MSLTSATRIVVIGGTSGIGLAVAQAAVEVGASVVVGSASAGSVERALARLPQATGLAVDVTSPESVQAFYLTVGKFDHLVYTAGDELLFGPIAAYRPEAAARFFEVRLFRALDAVRAALPTLRATGSITLTSGAAAFKGGTGALLGAAVSGAINSAGRSLAAELAPIRVNVVAPGIARTPLWDGVPEQQRTELLAHAGDATLLSRVAEPQDVAKAYLHLMDQDYVTGTVSLVDGGGLLH